MLDYRIETFIALCKERNYSKTAQKLCITQPAVTQHIQYLERYYNCKLFEYENKQLKLTPQGMVLERLALGLSASSSRFKKLIEEMDSKGKTFTFGASITVSEYILPPIITGTLKEDSKINLNIHVDSGRKIIEALKAGKLECAFIEGDFNREELKYYKFTTGEYILVSNKKMDEITVYTLLEETLITREEGASCHELLSNELSKHGRNILDFSRHVYTNNVSFIKKLLINGAGIGLVYKNSITKELEEGLLYEIPVDMNFSQEFHFVMLKNNLFTHDYEAFFTYASELYADSLDSTTKE